MPSYIQQTPGVCNNTLDFKEIPVNENSKSLITVKDFEIEKDDSKYFTNSRDIFLHNNNSTNY